MSTIRKRALAIGGALLLIVIGLGIARLTRSKSVAGGGAGTPLVVTIAPVEQRDVALYTEWIGTLDGLVNADVRGQVIGYLLRQDYKEGDFVKTGELLF